MELVEELNKNYIRTVNQVSTVDGKKFDDILVKKGTKYSVELLKFLSDHYLALVTIE